MVKDAEALKLAEDRAATSRPKSKPMFSRNLSANTLEVRAALLSIRGRFADMVPEDALSRAELVLAELLNNIAEHGGGPEGQAPDIHITVLLESNGLSCSVSDNGTALPRSCLASDPPEPQSFPEGGFGWFLIGQLTQALAYFRENGRNYVAFTIPLVEDAETTSRR